MTWELVGKSVEKNRTVEHIEQLLGLEHVAERLTARLEREADPDVLHRIELAISQTRSGVPSTELADAYAGLDERMFRTVEVGPAPRWTSS